MEFRASDRYHLRLHRARSVILLLTGVPMDNADLETGTIDQRGACGGQSSATHVRSGSIQGILIGIC